MTYRNSLSHKLAWFNPTSRRFNDKHIRGKPFLPDQARGFAFVEMTNKSEAIKAIQGLDGQELNGRALKVNEARPKEERGGGGNRGGGFSRQRREPRW